MPLQSIIPIPRASEKLVEALVRAGIIEFTDDGIKCVEKTQKNSTS